MSATVTLFDKDLGPDGVRRYRTRWKVLVKSHQYIGTASLSDSLISVSTSKNVKSVGSLSIALTGDKNYLNLVYPNDYITAYCDRGDGQGWTRVFFGFVDQIEVAERVDPASGKPSTLYTIQCSDFQKAFERTEIYFNPHVAARRDFDGGFVGTPNIGGAALRTRGLRVFGTPADLVLNTTLLLLGFGSQYILPNSYNPRLLDRIRQQRADFILRTLSTDVRNQIIELGGYANFLEAIRSRLGISNTVDALIDPESPDALSVSRADRRRFSDTTITALSPRSTVGSEDTRAANERGQEAYNVLNTTVAGFPPTLLDVIDIFTFVEREAIDGYTMEMSMWERQGSLMSFLRSVSNEIVNELFFDLRPVSREGGLVAGVDYSRDLDDLQGNAADSSGGITGILYQPAIVMREYPFSTIDNINASHVPLTIRQRGPTGSPDVPETTNLGFVYCGAIFSNRPNEPGRHVITTPSINPNSQVFGIPTRDAKKHLDVAVVSDKEIMSTRFSRSDSDHFNLFELLSESSIFGESSRFFMMDLLPIITPTHVVRHGLRTRRLSTRFARNSLELINHITPEPPPAAAEESTPAAPEPPAVPTPSTTVLPVELVTSGGRYAQGYVSSANRWWYRSKTFNGTRHVNNNNSNPVPAAGVRYWRFHNGVDIMAPRGTPVRAVRDGVVVFAAPVGTTSRTGYGNVVMVYHEADDIYSVYAHLDEIAANLRVVSRSRSAATYSSRRINPRGRYQEVRVSAGDQIGTVGDTDCEGPNGGVHLHFEFNVMRNGRVFPASLQRNDVTPDVFRDAATAISGYPVSASQPANPSEASTVSQDPVRIFSERFRTLLPVGRDVIEGALPIDDAAAIPGNTFSGDEAEDSSQQPTPVTPTRASSAADKVNANLDRLMSGHVDSPGTRRILARWALLQDHWYQHNLEYLSGSIEMRGAPEIRVGYRLDLVDRNMSFYVEGVSHTWSYAQPMTTTLHVTRGQPNNPFPVYVVPATEGFAPTETQRKTSSRLASFFVAPDPVSVRRSIKLRRQSVGDPDAELLAVTARSSSDMNEVDTPNTNNGTVGERYNEVVVEATFGETDPVLDKQLSEAEDLASLLEGAGVIQTGGFRGNPQGNTEMSDLLADIIAGSTTGGGG